jgi:hypothetical protein
MNDSVAGEKNSLQEQSFKEELCLVSSEQKNRRKK